MLGEPTDLCWLSDCHMKTQFPWGFMAYPYKQLLPLRHTENLALCKQNPSLSLSALCIYSTICEEMEILSLSRGLTSIKRFKLKHYNVTRILILLEVIFSPAIPAVPATSWQLLDVNWDNQLNCQSGNNKRTCLHAYLLRDWQICISSVIYWNTFVEFK